MVSAIEDLYDEGVASIRQPVRDAVAGAAR
jgi:hypothetical protein